MADTSMAPTSEMSRTTARRGPLPVARSLIGGALMGLANLVPGVSGGTMILVMGLYDEFIASIADVTRLRLTRRNVFFLALVGGAAVVAIAALAGTLSRTVVLHRSAMFSLFIGLTLGGAPLLLRMLHRLSPAAIAGVLAGLLTMCAITATQEPPPNRTALKEAVASGRFVIQPAYSRDLAAGALGMSAMVLPGISGAYMLLILGRYEAILGAISVAKDFAMSWGERGDVWPVIRVVAPTAIGAIGALVILSNFLKWLLERHEKPTLGVLLGILLGSVVGIWPFDGASQAGDYAVGALLAVGGFVFTLYLSRINA